MPTTLPPDNKFRLWLTHNFIRSWLGLLSLVIISLLSIGLQLLNPWPLKLLIDSVFGTIAAPGPLRDLDANTLLLVVAGSYVLIYLIGGIVDLLNQYLSSKLSLQLGVKLKTELFQHILDLPIYFKRKLRSGDYVYRLNEETDNLPALIFSTSTYIMQGIITIVAALVILASINFQMAIIGLFIVPLLYFSIRYFTPRIAARSNEIETATSDIYSNSSESIENVEIIQAFNRATYQTDSFREMLQQRLRLNLRLNMLNGGFDFFNNLLTSIGVGIIVVIGGHKVMNGSITLGELLVFVTYMSYFYDPLQNILSSIGDYKSLLVGIKRVFGVLLKPTITSETAPGTTRISRASGHIIFKDVSFRYGSHTILDKINFEIMPGQKVAFVGHSGSGKSTILNLLPRFNRTASGLIYLDKDEITTIDLQNLREQFGIVTQDPALFSGTIHENIAFAEPDEKLDLPDILAAAASANATEFIEKLPDKYETSIGEAGDSLSGGQKQRISIARAFLKNAPILLLDEPTSAQDPESESKILNAIIRLMEGRTVLMVTHHVALLREMDAVYVVDNAKVAHVNEYGGLDSYLYKLMTH